MKKEELEKLWPDWRIEFVCETAFDKLRNILGINFIYLENTGWEADNTEDENDADCYCIGIKADCPEKPERSKTYFFTARLFTANYMPKFDDTTNATKVANLRDKVILRIAHNFKDYWDWGY